ncbi:MAG: hypothetical protein E6J50_09420, partial [Chloroflexi bacterium]
AVQTRMEDVAAMRASRTWDAQPEHVVTVMDGRSVWPDHFESARQALEPALADRGTLRLVPSTSLMFLPYTVEGEDLPPGFQFAREKTRRLAQWSKALAGDGAPDEVEPPTAQWPQIGGLVPRESRPQRKVAQRDLNLPRFPTTSTGSLPQTAEVRHMRVQRTRGEIDEGMYRSGIDRLICDAIRWQDAKGMDVLVHGEFERTDMVEYFAERMNGFFTTRAGWVLSYGSRCTRPPILDAPPTIAEPITVREWQVAQAATSKPVKGMLTGPVTIVNWSFRPPDVPDDLLFWAVAGPIAEEVGHLVDVGARIVQIDEPAVRERWPLPTEEAPELRAIYARGVRAALNRVFNQPIHVQMHTHMCYGDFGEIVPLWSDAGVDVASIEFSRSKDDSYIHQFYELFGDGHLQIGPGVFDVHSPHSPGVDTMSERLEHFRDFMDDGDLWINPDCGLKTRSWEEIDRQLGDMVAAANGLRAARAACSRPLARGSRWWRSIHRGCPARRTSRFAVAGNGSSSPTTRSSRSASRRMPSPLALRMTYPRCDPRSSARPVTGTSWPSSRRYAAHSATAWRPSSSSRGTCFPRWSTGATATRSWSTFARCSNRWCRLSSRSA